MLNFGSEVNAMTSAYIAKLGFTPRITNIGTQKIDGSVLETYGMVPAEFSIYNKLNKAWFLEETFLLTDINMKMVLRTSFLFLSNENLQFGTKKFP